MASIRCRKASGNLFFDFRFQGKRCREQTLLKDTPANKKKLQLVLNKIEAEITLGSFDYATYFPNSKNVKKFSSFLSQPTGINQTPLFKDFAQIWADEMAAEWRPSHYENTLLIFRKYIFPSFAHKEVGRILVYKTLQEQMKVTGNNDYVFCSTKLTPLNGNNFARRIWKPLLSYLGLRYRRPYQTRHTAATLWLAAGESPEWIARQMGHTTTEMLFSVYSRFVPNLTRQDGTAIERLLKANGLTTPEEPENEAE